MPFDRQSSSQWQASGIIASSSSSSSCRRRGNEGRQGRPLSSAAMSSSWSIIENGVVEWMDGVEKRTSDGPSGTNPTGSSACEKREIDNGNGAVAMVRDPPHHHHQHTQPDPDTGVVGEVTSSSCPFYTPDAAEQPPYSHHLCRLSLHTKQFPTNPQSID